jgi:hypothetical protein
VKKEKGMPSEKEMSADNLLRQVIVGNKASDEQMLLVLEHWKGILSHRMKEFSSGTLGETACLGNGDGFFHEIYKDDPLVPANFSLDTRGIFGDGNLAHFDRQTSYCRTFGLDTKGNWLSISIKFETLDVDNKGYQKAVVVRVHNVKLVDLIEEYGIHWQSIWFLFKYTVDCWVSDRDRLNKEAIRLGAAMNNENTIVNMIS